MDQLENKVREVISWYASAGLGLRTFLVENTAQKVFAVIVTDHPVRQDPAAVVVLARIIDDKVMIEEDMTDKPLTDKLLDAGIPREQIIKAYAGERLPDPVQS